MTILEVIFFVYLCSIRPVSTDCDIGLLNKKVEFDEELLLNIKNGEEKNAHCKNDNNIIVIVNCHYEENILTYYDQQHTVIDPDKTCGDDSTDLNGSNSRNPCFF